MSKTEKKRVNKKLIIVLCLIFFTLICMICTLFLILKKEKENVKEELSYIDFEQGLAQEYQLLNCNISEDSIEFYLSGIKDSYYTAMCKNLENHMKYYLETKENANQETFKFYLYKNNTKDYINEEPEAIVTYYLYQDSCIVEKSETLPSIEKTDGLLPYQFLDFDGTTLTVSMELDEYSLLEKAKQMQVLYNMACELNYMESLILQVQDNDMVYVYNGTRTVKIIESRKINY